jgi:hypothetical protein
MHILPLLLPSLLLPTTALASSSTQCTIRKIPTDCFTWEDNKKPTGVGAPITFTDEYTSTTSSGHQYSQLWRDLWSSVSPCKDVSTDTALKRAYIFPELGCAGTPGKELERFNGAVFVSSLPVLHLSL